MHAGKMASPKLGEDDKVVGVRLGSGYGVEDADELVLSKFANCFDNLFSDQRVFVMTCAAPQRLLKSKLCALAMEMT